VAGRIAASREQGLRTADCRLGDWATPPMRLTGLAPTPSMPIHPSGSSTICWPGEQVSIALLAMALHAWGAGGSSMNRHPGRDCHRSRPTAAARHTLSYAHRSAQRKLLRTRLRPVVVAGLPGHQLRAVQGTPEITTLGAGGIGPPRPVALAAAMGAEACEILHRCGRGAQPDPGQVAGAQLMEERSACNEMPGVWPASGRPFSHPRSAGGDRSQLRRAAGGAPPAGVRAAGNPP